MKKNLLALLTVASLALPAAADQRQALESFKPRLDAAKFSGAYLTAQGQLALLATAGYAALPAAERARSASSALLDWSRTFVPAPPPNLTIYIKWKGGGELWTLKKRGPEKVDFWTDSRLPFTPVDQGKNRFFGYLGAQMMGGGDMEESMSAFNGRLGTTLFKERCDVSVLYGYSKMGEAGLSAYGLTGRMLFPLSGDVGWNLGASFTRSAPSEGDASNSIAALGGLNFYLPGGSFDVTASVGNNKMLSVLVGYTIYLTGK